MNDEILKGKWNQYKGEAKKKWGQFTDDEIDQLNGEKDIIIGKIQEKYGKSKDEAEREFNDWYNRLG
ncbi:CsbD family protein [Clostridium polynesiense]|uniref:CsbD family protein n=1 Tax=Clostridium polynesiense TaxID=1325933 RepID=UPI0005909491|nr:CsbD family protein [Clostridium polynesiense]